MPLTPIRGATYFIEAAQWIQRQSPQQQKLFSLCLALFDALVGVCKGIYLKSRSWTPLSLEYDTVDASWHMKNASARIALFSRQLFRGANAPHALTQGQHQAIRRTIHEHLRKKPMEESITIEDATQPHDFEAIYCLPNAEPTARDTLMTTRTYARTDGGTDKYVPIKLLDDLQKAETEEKQLEILENILSHETLCERGPPQKTQEYRITVNREEVVIPSVSFENKGEISTNLRNYLNNEEIRTALIEQMVALVKRKIQAGIKREISLDIERCREDSTQHTIGETTYSSLSEKSIQEQVDEMWERTYNAVSARMRGANTLDIFRETAFIMDHMSQTGFSLAHNPFNLRVMNIGMLQAFGLGGLINTFSHPVHIERTKEIQQITLSEDADKLTGKMEVAIGIRSEHDPNDEAITDVCIFECTTDVDLLNRKAIITWKIKTGEE